jgi:cation-transporting ATPase E
MLGDGVNDVPAMKRADLAIAVNEGAQAARGVADLVLLESSFVALPIAFREGQRVLAGMQNILRLFLTRIGYMSLLIAATALVDIGFPYTPKQSGLVSFFAVGAPALVLVLIARPAQQVRERLVAGLVRFVVPSAWSLALIGLLVYVAYASSTNVERAQAALTLITILCGIALAMFAAPPTRFWSAPGAALAGWPAGALGVALLAGLGWLLADDARRSFFDLGALTAFDVVLSLVICAAWVASVRLVWSRDLFERALGITRFGVAT